MADAMSLVSRFIKVAEADAGIARVQAERKKYQDDLQRKKESFAKLEHQFKKAKKLHDEKKLAFSKEEKFLKEEREKISERRKGLASHNNYKVQQAAEKELDYLARQINLKEESLIKTITEIDDAGKEMAQQEEQLNGIGVELASLQKEFEEVIPSLDERLHKFTTQRQELIHGIDNSLLTQYERVRTKHPMDPIVMINEQKLCSGCYMQVGANITFQVNKGDALVKCPGCGRLLSI